MAEGSKAEIKDAKGKRLGRVLTTHANLGIAMVDLSRLNKNGPEHEYTLEGLRALLWQPVWMDIGLGDGDSEMSAAQQVEKATQEKQKLKEHMKEHGDMGFEISDIQKGKPPGVQ